MAFVLHFSSRDSAPARKCSSQGKWAGWRKSVAPMRRFSVAQRGIPRPIPDYSEGRSGPWAARHRAEQPRNGKSPAAPTCPEGKDTGLQRQQTWEAGPDGSWATEQRIASPGRGSRRGDCEKGLQPKGAGTDELRKWRCKIRRWKDKENERQPEIPTKTESTMKRHDSNRNQPLGDFSWEVKGISPKRMIRS